MDHRKRIKSLDHEKKALKLVAKQVDPNLGEEEWLASKVLTRVRMANLPFGGKPYTEDEDHGKWKKFQQNQRKQQDGTLSSTGTQRKRSGLPSYAGIANTTGVSPPLKKATTIYGLGLAGTAAQSRPPQ